MIIKSKSRKVWPGIFLCVILVVFIITKIPALGLPYFWDELGVYSRAGLYLHDNGLGLLPHALPPELSRGHPLIFPFLSGLSFSLFGDTLVTAHVTALMISIFLLISVYYITSKIFSPATALLAVMLMIAQPIFFAQSALLLPEILLAMFMLWAIYFWVNKQLILYALFSSLAILTKETAIIIPVVIIVSEGINLVAVEKERQNFKLRPSHLFVLVPFVIYGIFLIIQKAQNGWYLFPLHEENIGLHPERFINFSWDYITFIFYEQGRIIITITSVLILIYLLIKRELKLNRFSLFLVVLLAGGISFNALNFYMNRYTLFIIISTLILMSSVIIQYSKKFPVVMIMIPVILICCIYTLDGDLLFGNKPVSLKYQDRFDYDENMSYLSYIEIQEQAINQILKSAGSKDRIFANFPVSIALADPRYGYTKKKAGRDFTLQHKMAHQTGFQYALISDPGSYDYSLPSIDSLTVIKTYADDVVKIVLYKPKYQ